MSVNQELLSALEYLIEVRYIQCLHKHDGPDDACALCRARAAISKAKAEKR